MRDCLRCDLRARRPVGNDPGDLLRVPNGPGETLPFPILLLACDPGDLLRDVYDPRIVAPFPNGPDVGLDSRDVDDNGCVDNGRPSKLPRGPGERLRDPWLLPPRPPDGNFIIPGFPCKLPPESGHGAMRRFVLTCQLLPSSPSDGDPTRLEPGESCSADNPFRYFFFDTGDSGNFPPFPSFASCLVKLRRLFVEVNKGAGIGISSTDGCSSAFFKGMVVSPNSYSNDS